jgi:hypothetical protein
LQLRQTPLRTRIVGDNIIAARAFPWETTMNAIRAVVLLVLTLGCVGRAAAQVDGFATRIVIPLVASTQSFVSEIVIKDQSNTSRSVVMEFYEALTSITPGLKSCATVSLAPFESKIVTLADNCALTNASHHGFVVLTDASANKDKLFSAYSRVENPKGQGFTVEGFPMGHIGGGESFSEVAGVKRKAAAATLPAFKTNCFVATLDGTVDSGRVDYTIELTDAQGSLLGSVTDALTGPFQMRRYNDIYAAAGLPPPGDHENTTVTFFKDNTVQFPNTLITFCTVEDSAQIAADFRIGKNESAADPTRNRLNCFAASFGINPGECTSTLQLSAPEIPNATTKVRLITRVYAPDTVNCSIISSRAAELEMRLVRDFPAGVVAGGSNQNAFTYSTGARSSFGSGFHQYYFLEVGPRSGVTGYPIPFGIRCMAGNGMMDPRFFEDAVHDF